MKNMGFQPIAAEKVCDDSIGKAEGTAAVVVTYRIRKGQNRLAPVIDINPSWCVDHPGGCGSFSAPRNGHYI
jgi:hypothetical protein